MEPIDPTHIAQLLQRFAGQGVYLHVEFTRGGFARNVQATVEETAVRGEGPYRVALRCAGGGWVVMEGLTHMDAPAGAPLFLGGLESDQRLSCCLQISTEPFAP